MRVIVAGAVAWADAEVIRRELAKLPPGAVVVHGDCPGADALAGAVAIELSFAVEAMAKNAAARGRSGRGAWKGLNERMLATGAGLVLVFHAAFDESKGSKHLAELAARAGVEVRVFAE